MIKHSILNIVAVMTMLDVFVKTHLTAYDSDHGFVSNDHEKYFGNDLSSVHEEFKTSIVRNPPLNNLNVKLLLKFEPEHLDFRLRPLGVPYLERVTLFNTDNNKSIDMTSISGTTVHFHSSFFVDKRIPPLGNTSFNVVFLGRQEGLVESNLFIHTNEGHFRYKVKGASTSSPFRLRPLVGVKLPPNITFSPFIHLYNPYMEPIQITEMYSSGGDFHLELPSGELEGPKNMWEIPPLQTKPIIRVRFHAKAEQNHTAYIRIKLNNTEDILVVPLEVEVTPNVGLYVPEGLIDFGVGGSLDSVKQVDLNVFNALKKPVRVHNISSTSKSIKIDYENVKIPVDVKKSSVATKIATLTLDWKSALENQEFSGKIVVYYRNGKSKIEIPYYVTVLEGGVSFNKSITTYFINDSPQQMLSRNVMLRNNFATPLALTDISLAPEAETYFNVPDFKPVILKPHEEASVFSLALKAISNLNLRSSITLKTNVSDIVMPVLSYSGKLTVRFPYKGKDNSLDMGVVGLNSKKSMTFLIVNANPVYVNIDRMTLSIPSSSVEIFGCGKGIVSSVLLVESVRNLTYCTGLGPEEFALIRLVVHTFDKEGAVKGDVLIQTQFEHLSVPVSYKAAQGKLEIGPDRLVFDQCFPGKICSHPLKVHSTFNDPMVIENILSIPPDPRLSTKHLGHIMARSTKIVGHLYLDPSLGCSPNCYSGLNSEDTSRWVQSLTLPKNSTAELDLSLVNSLYNRYLNETSGGTKKWQNLTMRLDTSEVKWHIFKTRVKMSWPSLVVEDSSGNKSSFKFPLTQVGNISYYNITIRNPSSHNLIVQLVLSSTYPGLDTLNDGLPPNLMPNRKYQQRPDHEQAFFFKEGYDKHHNRFKTATNIDVNKESLPLLLSSNENFTVVVGFKAENSVLKQTLLYVRNNLTVLEVLQLNGQGAIPNFKFGNRRPGSIQPLAFELTEKHLKDCEYKKRTSPNLTVKRTFTARNMGEVPVFVQGFFINGLPCEGYGYRILNCNPFALLPNSTRKIDIAFTPDFTLAKVVRTLTLKTSLNIVVSYTLMATVPPSYLSACSIALTRPAWEPFFYYIALSVACLLLIVVGAIIVVETEQNLKDAAVLAKRTSPTTQSTLDLKLVGIQTRAEIHSQKAEEPAVPKEKPKVIETKSHDSHDTDTTVSPPPPDDGGIKQPQPQPQPPPPPPPKPECEKYSVLIPTTGKSKKKLSKKLELSMSGNDDVHEKCCEVSHQKHKHKHSDKTADTDAGTSSSAKKIAEAKEAKKKGPFKKNLVIKSSSNSSNSSSSTTNVVEEESSSTTTESSNYEEAEKDCGSKFKKSRIKKSPITKEAPSAAAIMKPQQQNVDIIPSTKAESYKKNIQKIVQKTKEKDKEVQENKTEIKVNSWEFKPKIITNKSNMKERMGRSEKQTVTKKSPMEKKLIDYWCPPTTSTTRTSPTSQSSGVWGENKATFSDVVARSENAPMTVIQPRSVQNHSASSKPTMYVEPYKQVTGNLGPIGSRKNEYYQRESHSPNVQADQQFSQISSSNSNSFFSDSHELNLESLNLGENWDHQHRTNIASQLIRAMRPNLMGPSNSLMQQDPWCSSSTSTSSELWDTNRASTSSNESATNQSPTNPESDYLWGTSSVWQPWSPLETRRRMPPGLAGGNQNETEERAERNHTYDLFGMTNIWAQQYPNPWNYPQGH